MSFVLDASLALSWFFEDERSEYADSVKVCLVRQRALVPMLWGIEVANGLIVAERRKRVSSRTVERAPHILARLPIDADPTLPGIRELTDLARKHMLSAYDAVYLRLVIQRRLSVASLDRKLVEACLAEGAVAFAP